MAQQGPKIGGMDMEQFFQKMAESYEDSVPIVKDIARSVIKRTPSIASDSIILDNACGPGIVTGQIINGLNSSTTPQFFADA
jgi:hypothetical protein